MQSKRTLAAPFVVTIAACGHEAGPNVPTPASTDTIAVASASAPPTSSAPSVAPTSSTPTTPSTPDAGAPESEPLAVPLPPEIHRNPPPPARLNAEVGGRTVYRHPHDVCVVHVPGPGGGGGWHPPSEKVVPCPAGMRGPGWDVCSGGQVTKYFADDGTAARCECSRDGNPPPPNVSMKCP